MKKIIITLMFLVATPVYAQTAPYGQSNEVQQPTTDPSVSITISPIHLVLPAFEVTAELKVAPKIGIAGVIGFGTITVEDDYGDENTFKFYELGAQFRYYAIGSFKSGLHFGVETTYIHVSGEIDDVQGVGTGLAIGGFVGYKHTFSFGLVLEGQIGYQVVAYNAHASDDNGNSDSASDSKGSILLNLNIGYSF
ncbi:DUF3575 domain-containing protein [Myxococcota bacterium]|nr:DUF3575 domain-containing protein [Myxococcota bacterium]MBU1382731.1 DUF3575 domain-containing protein [Myxococcota bacterium]MBU1498291.1 DUF3575 domain-containing protein [Myxococcota bacterium]